MALVFHIFGDRQLEVEAARLKNDAGLLTHAVGFACYVEALNASDAAARNHEGGEDAKECGLAAAIRSQKSENLCSLDGKRQVVERQPVPIIVRKAVKLNGQARGRTPPEGSLPAGRSVSVAMR